MLYHMPEDWTLQLKSSIAPEVLQLFMVFLKRESQD